MRLFILGKNSDDKGKQLEKLTSAILKKLGFKNIVKNEIGNGGQEIDVRAEYVVPGLGGNSIKPLICECKAYKTSVPITDWLKFLGKVLIEETKGNIDACFIALCGVNGNVSGNYRELTRSNRKNIKLITGDDLVEQLKTTFSIVDIDIIQDKLPRLTVRKPIEICYCYYNMRIYFLVGFSDNLFTVLSENGNQVNKDEGKMLKKLIPQTTNYLRYVDLEEENKSNLRFRVIKKFIIAFLLMHNNSLNIKDFSNRFKPYANEFPQLSENEILNAIDALVGESIVLKEGNDVLLKILSDERLIEDVVSFYRSLLEYNIPIMVLGNENYLKYIDEELLNQICKIQGNISVPLEYREKCLKILKCSPGALLLSLTPDAMLVNHRFGGKPLSEELDNEDTMYFIQKLIDQLLEDFKNQGLGEYFLKKCNIAELEVNNNLTVKSKIGVELDLAYKERIGLAQMTSEYANQVIAIRVFNNQPEPWESVVDAGQVQ